MIQFDEIENLSHEQKVEFAIYCAEDCLDVIENEKIKEFSKNCIHLAKKWLQDHNSITTEEIKDATLVEKLWNVGFSKENTIHAYEAATFALKTTCINDNLAIFVANSAANSRAENYDSYTFKYRRFLNKLKTN
jgi:hypothetical protein